MENQTKRHDMENRSIRHSQKEPSAITLAIPENDRIYPAGWKLAIIIISLSLGNLLIAIDNTIIAVAIPVITTRFNSLNDVGWYGSAYLLSITALQPTFGNVYKYFDVKATYLISIVVFEGTHTRSLISSRPSYQTHQEAQSSALLRRTPLCLYLDAPSLEPVQRAYSRGLWALWAIQ